MDKNAIVDHKLFYVTNIYTHQEKKNYGIKLEYSAPKMQFFVHKYPIDHKGPYKAAFK